MGHLARGILKVRVRLVFTRRAERVVRVRRILIARARSLRGLIEFLVQRTTRGLVRAVA